MKTITTIGFLASALLANAQADLVPMSPDQLVRYQSEQISKALGLGSESQERLNAVLIGSVKETEPLREKCRSIDRAVNETYDSRLKDWVGTLDEKKQQQYWEARRNGSISFTSCGAAACAPSKGATGCGEAHGQERSLNGAAKSCCAAGAHGEAKPADPGTKQPEKK